MHVRLLSLCALIVFSLVSIVAQTSSNAADGGSGSSAAPASAESRPTFHATSRLVLVDVVVTDKKGVFIRNLKPADFTVFEDGKPQRITAFGAHVAADSPRPAPQIDLPPHQYTNYNAISPDHPITIVLLDMLNTVITERAYAREQMLKFLSSMPTGQPVGLFALTSNLKMLQGFTQNSDALIAAAKSVKDKNESVRLHTPEGELEDAEANAAMLAALGIPSATAAFLSRALNNEQQYQLDLRVRSTFAALRALAAAVAGYPGRKNLIWLSGDFPIALGPEGDSNPQLPNYLAYQSEVHETTALLSSSQIAVYPVDVRGLQDFNPTGSFGGRPSRDEMDPNGQMGRQVTAQINTQTTMKEIAEETGGEAFYNDNDLKSLMRRSLDQGSNYYTLAYVPVNHDWNRAYRKIDVKVAGEDLKLRHRRGYYALPETGADGRDAAHLLMAAMRATVPETTRLLLKVQVLPPDGQRKTVSVDLSLVPSQLIFLDSDDQHKKATVDFMAVALDKHLKDAAVVSNTVDANLQPDMYQKMMHGAFPDHLELDLKPGKYILRLGAIDRNSQKIGTVDVPLEVGPQTTAD